MVAGGGLPRWHFGLTPEITHLEYMNELADLVDFGRIKCDWQGSAGLSIGQRQTRQGAGLVERQYAYVEK